jgi:hypothetical protein
MKERFFRRIGISAVLREEALVTSDSSLHKSPLVPLYERGKLHQSSPFIKGRQRGFHARLELEGDSVSKFMQSEGEAGLLRGAG